MPSSSCNAIATALCPQKPLKLVALASAQTGQEPGDPSAKVAAQHVRARLLRDPGPP